MARTTSALRPLARTSAFDCARASASPHPAAEQRAAPGWASAADLAVQPGPALLVPRPRSCFGAELFRSLFCAGRAPSPFSVTSGRDKASNTPAMTRRTPVAFGCPAPLRVARLSFGAKNSHLVPKCPRCLPVIRCQKLSFGAKLSALPACHSMKPKIPTSLTVELPQVPGARMTCENAQLLGHMAFRP